MMLAWCKGERYKEFIDTVNMQIQTHLAELKSVGIDPDDDKSRGGNELSVATSDMGLILDPCKGERVRRAAAVLVSVFPLDPKEPVLFLVSTLLDAIPPDSGNCSFTDVLVSVFVEKKAALETELERKIFNFSAFFF